MKYQKQKGTQGAWLPKDKIKTGDKAVIVAETKPIDSGEFGTQDVTKVRIKGLDESYNTNLNKTTINGLIDAFGEDSKDWINKILTVQKEKMIVGGKRVTATYFIPEGYELGEDSEGYLVITKTGEASTKTEVEDEFEYPSDEIDPENIPF